MHTSNIINNFNNICKLPLGVNPNYFSEIYEYIQKEIGPTYINEETDIPLLVRWLGLYDDAFRIAFIIYLISYLYERGIPKEKLVELIITNLRIDILEARYNVLREYLPKKIFRLFSSNILRRIKNVINPDNYQVILTSRIIYNFKDIIRLRSNFKEVITVDKFIQNKPYIFTFVFSKPLDFIFYLKNKHSEKNNYIIFYKNNGYIGRLKPFASVDYLIQVKIDGSINIVRFNYHNPDLENLIQEKINICSGENYEDLFTNLEQRKFLSKKVNIYDSAEVDIILNTFLGVWEIVPRSITNIRKDE